MGSSRMNAVFFDGIAPAFNQENRMSYRFLEGVALAGLATQWNYLTGEQQRLPGPGARRLVVRALRFFAPLWLCVT